MTRTTLTTYYKGKDPKQDSKEFTVPTEWLQTFLNKEYEGSVNMNEFISSYTWDEAEWIERKAKDDKVFNYKNNKKGLK